MFLKSQLVSKLSRDFPHLPESDIALAVSRLIERLSTVLVEGGRIELRGFGSFNLHYRKPRRAHNPKTGEKLVTEPKYAVHFKPGKELRERINANRHVPILGGTDDHPDNEEE